MALTQGQMSTLKANNPTLRMGLYPHSTTGLANSRIIIFGKNSSVSNITVVSGGIDLSSIQFMKAIHNANPNPKPIEAPYYPKTVAVTIT
ncbi:hypothetical protein QF028_003064 [Neobacillus sp. B4I6]|uniref:hypothetical protein n=1 Tax=Neobacillus sp. B4I6 TaxID=3373925 RepID=UPI003D1946C3